LKNQPPARNAWTIGKTFKLQSLDLTFSAIGEWANVGGTDQNKAIFTKISERFPQLQSLRIMVIKTIFNYESIMHSILILQSFARINKIQYEFLNSQISDVEIIAFAHGLMKVKQLKVFSIKVLQKGGISEECIEKFAGILSNLDNLQKFDLYFRKLDIHPQGIVDLGTRIQNFKNIQCSCSKESIYIYRKIN